MKLTHTDSIFDHADEFKDGQEVLIRLKDSNGYIAHDVFKLIRRKGKADFLFNSGCSSLSRALKRTPIEVVAWEPINSET